MKVIVQIPCFNEAETLGRVFDDMPAQIPGVDQLEFLIIDDGCTDNTREVAHSLGVHHIVTIKQRNRRWLGRAFRRGVDEALAQGADILVNTDGDGQYPSSVIPELIRPILEGRADLVIGNRNPESLQSFSPVKRLLSHYGNNVVQFLTGNPTPDALSGFRAYSRSALEQLNVISNYTYTIDTLMQAYQKGLDVAWLPISARPPTRPSRLFRSSWDAVWRGAPNILRQFFIYQPFRVLFGLSLFLLALGGLLFLRYGYFVSLGESSGHVQSLVIGAASLLLGFQLAVLAILGDVLSVIRNLLEESIRLLKTRDAAKPPQVRSVATISRLRVPRSEAK